MFKLCVWIFWLFFLYLHCGQVLYVFVKIYGVIAYKFEHGMWQWICICFFFLPHNWQHYMLHHEYCKKLFINLQIYYGFKYLFAWFHSCIVDKYYMTFLHYNYMLIGWILFHAHLCICCCGNSNYARFVSWLNLNGFLLNLNLIDAVFDCYVCNLFMNCKISLDPTE